MPMNENDSTLESVDTNAIASDIASELGFGSAAEGGASRAEEKPEVADPNPAASPENAADGPAPGTAAFEAMPKAWKKEMEAHWAKLDPEVRKYVNSREADVSRGIQMYQQGHSSWQRLLTPYQKIFESYPNLDPVQLLQGVMNQHLQLAQGTPEQKRAIAAQMLKSYGLEFPSEAQTPSEGSIDSHPAFQALQNRLAQVEALWTAAQNAAQQQSYTKNLSEVEAFSSDPKNSHWPDVVEDVLLLIKKGAASTLPEAYELACLRNPAVKAKMLAESAPQPPAPAKAASLPNINGSTVAPRARKMSMEDTIGAVVAKHYQSH